MTSGQQFDHYNLDLDLDDHHPLDRISMPDIEVQPVTALEIDPRPLPGDQLRAWREACRWGMRPSPQHKWTPSRGAFAELIGLPEGSYRSLETRETIEPAWAAMMRAVFDERMQVPDGVASGNEVRAVVAILGKCQRLGDLLGRKGVTVREWCTYGAPANGAGRLLRWIVDDIGLSPVEDINYINGRSSP